MGVAYGVSAGRESDWMREQEGAAARFSVFIHLALGWERRRVSPIWERLKERLNAGYIARVEKRALRKMPQRSKKSFAGDNMLFEC